MARLAIRATSDRSTRQKVQTAQSRVLLTVERDGKDYATLGIYRVNDGASAYDGGICLTIEGGKVPTIERDATGTRHVLRI